jgi:hypothetical protein
MVALYGSGPDNIGTRVPFFRTERSRGRDTEFASGSRAVPLKKLTDLHPIPDDSDTRAAIARWLKLAELADAAAQAKRNERKKRFSAMRSLVARTIASARRGRK